MFAPGGHPLRGNGYIVVPGRVARAAQHHGHGGEDPLPAPGRAERGAPALGGAGGGALSVFAGNSTNWHECSSQSVFCILEWIFS